MPSSVARLGSGGVRRRRSPCIRTGLSWFSLALLHFLLYAAVNGDSTGDSTPRRGQPQLVFRQALQTGRIQEAYVQRQAAAKQGWSDNGTRPLGTSTTEPALRRDQQQGSSLGRRRKLGAMSPASLYNEWTSLYQVERRARRKLDGSQFVDDYPDLLPSEMAPPPSQCPHFPAPHLLCCNALTHRRHLLEQLGPNGELPDWTQPQPGGNPDQKPYPRPPWVRGSPDENLPMTHQVQTDIWRHQFPRDGCSSNSTKFLISWWDKPQDHGIGSHLHIMTRVLGEAMMHGRVLVVLNWTYTRANHEGCPREHYGSFQCYFFDVASKACSDAAIQGFRDATKRGEAKVFLRTKRLTAEERERLFSSSERFIVYSPHRVGWLPEPIPEQWGTPWEGINTSLALGINGPSITAPWHKLRVKKHWWRAQGVRFFLRWPSAYLCNLLNFARHKVYGLAVAEAVLEKKGIRPEWAQGTNTKVAELVETLDIPQSLCSKERPLCAIPDSDGKSTVGGGDIDPLPFIPRPMIRVHVRGSDKFQEMKLMGAGNYFNAMKSIQPAFRLPFKNVWLSSEEQAPFEEAQKLANWTVYKLLMELKHSAQDGTHPLNQWEFARKFGMRDYVEASFANLFISSLSDGFVLAFASNWDRLANELRLTSGKMRYPIVALNQGEI